MLSNATVINRAWKKVNKDAEMMYKKKAFLHHYVAEGMEESQFEDALENISTLIEDYNEVEKWKNRKKVHKIFKKIMKNKEKLKSITNSH